jgi:hypothetical protein
VNELVSYVVPFYNPCSQGRSPVWFVQCIESLLRQTHGDCEFLFVDDGSSDCSASIVRAFSEYDNRIWLLGAHGEEAHQGIEHALDLGLAAAQGQFIARLDSDDIAMPERTKTQLAYFRKHPLTMLLGGRMQVMSEGIKRAWALDYTSVRREARTHCPLFHPTVMFRRLVYEQFGGYPRGYDCAEDYAYWSRVLRWCRAENMPEVLTQYRVHGGQQGALYQHKQMAAAARIASECHDMPERSPFDKLLAAYCEEKGCTEDEVLRTNLAALHQRTALRWCDWWTGNPDAPRADFFVDAPDFALCELLDCLLTLWHGRWRLREFIIGKVLDYGGGLGIASLLKPGIQYVHYDPSPFCRRVVLRHTPTALAGDNPDLRPHTYDAVLAIHSLEFMERDRILPMLDMLVAALKPGGYFLFDFAPEPDKLHPMRQGTPGMAEAATEIMTKRGLVRLVGNTVWQKGRMA